MTEQLDAKSSAARTSKTAPKSKARPEATAIAANKPAEATKKQTKTAMVLNLLTRSEGVTLDHIVNATGWLPHTARAALTGLKKKGHEVTSSRVDGVRTYRAVVTTQAQIPHAAEASQ